jgi:transcriptional regulator with XRE-family HTH domain
MTTSPQKLLQEIKARTGWSQPKIAAEIGTSQATVNRLLHGQSNCLATTALAIEQLAARLKIIPSRRRRTG